jgi:transcriptional regulator with XRE-family HTH domain
MSAVLGPEIRWDVRGIFALVAQLGWTDEQLAARLRYSGATISRIRSGEVKPSLRFYANVRRLFPQADIDALISPIEPEEAA